MSEHECSGLAPPREPGASTPTAARGGPSRERVGSGDPRPGVADAPRRARPRGPLETVTVERPRCPACRGIALLKYRSITDQGDGTALWWVRCGRCGHRFRVLLE